MDLAQRALQVTLRAAGDVEDHRAAQAAGDLERIADVRLAVGHGLAAAG